MTKIGLISDTHSYLDPAVYRHFENVDQIWHAGDIGSLEVLEELEKFKPVKAVYGNIDGSEIRKCTKLHQIFTVEEAKIFITHIGGYPGRYAPGVLDIIKKEKPNLFISGHSHILKVMMDQKRQCLHMNPGAAGKHGFHQVKTLLRFDVRAGIFENLEVIEMGKK